MKSIPTINVGQVLELKKPHPCGGKLFTVNRIGSDIKLTCNSCGRILILERVKVEKMIKNVNPGGNENE